MFSPEKSFECLLPASTFDMYNNLLTLDFQQESIKIGQFPLRVPLLVSMRVILTLIIEGSVFFICCVERKELGCLAINLITQGGLNALLTGPNLGPY